LYVFADLPDELSGGQALKQNVHKRHELSACFAM